ncbi:MAG: hypothetical protein ABMA64_08170 [Myxococcota bacterium]
MRAVLFGSMVVSGGCMSEAWVYAPTADERVWVAEGTLELEGVAVLTYDSAALPDEVVGHTLRMTVESSIDEDPILDYPDADPELAFSPSGTFADLNLDGVFPDCGEPTCVTEVPFVVVRDTDAEARLHLSADAILTKPALVHDTLATSGDATLTLVLADPVQ